MASKPTTQSERELCKKHSLGGMMHLEEAKMNRQLLRNISQIKFE
jgi:hypothetical protein